MKCVWVIVGCLLPLPLMAVTLYPEYNTWYSKDGILYDVTQTADSQPVLISIAQAGFASANMVVSLYATGKCTDSGAVANLKINGSDTKAIYRCVDLDKGRIEHYLVEDAGLVNQVIDRLRGEFTVVLQDDIKVWAANINNPRYGIAPGM